MPKETFAFFIAIQAPLCFRNTVHLLADRRTLSLFLRRGARLWLQGLLWYRAGPGCTRFFVERADFLGSSMVTFPHPDAGW